MTMAVMTAPVPAPIMAAIPTIAAEEAVRPECGSTDPDTAANEAPSVAPRTSEGEKIPPVAPQPRLIVVASSLSTKSSASSHAAVILWWKID